MLSINVVKKLKQKCRKQSQSIKYMFEYLMYIFEDQMCMFGYLKTPDVILSLVSSQKLDWTHTFDTHCNLSKYYDNILQNGCMRLLIFQFILDE